MPRVTAKQVVLELIRNAKSGAWFGKTRLYKAFYFAHLYYAEKQPGILTDWPIARMPEGPGIDSGDRLLGGLASQGHITIHRDHEGPYTEYSYTLSEKADGDPLPEDAREAIKEAAEYALSKSASELSQITHDHSRAWREGKDGDILDIYIDIIPQDEYEKAQTQLKALDQALAMALEGQYPLSLIDSPPALCASIPDDAQARYFRSFPPTLPPPPRHGQ